MLGAKGQKVEDKITVIIVGIVGILLLMFASWTVGYMSGWNAKCRDLGSMPCLRCSVREKCVDPARSKDDQTMWYCGHFRKG